MISRSFSTRRRRLSFIFTLPLNFWRRRGDTQDTWMVRGAALRNSRIATRVIAPIRPTDSSPHILVVDDDPQICRAYDEILRSHGYEVVTAGSRAAALAQ